jgi:hypothetical protein
MKVNLVKKLSLILKIHSNSFLILFHLHKLWKMSLSMLFKQKQIQEIGISRKNKLIIAFLIQFWDNIWKTFILISLTYGVRRLSHFRFKQHSLAFSSKKLKIFSTFRSNIQSKNLRSKSKNYILSVEVYKSQFWIKNNSWKLVTQLICKWSTFKIKQF